MVLARNVKRLRLQRGLSQRALAQRIKVSQAFIGQLETEADSNPTLATLRRLAKALKCKISELVE
jgi:transcriptional regulator with XRE-family HTH domain